MTDPRRRLMDALMLRHVPAGFIPPRWLGLVRAVLFPWDALCALVGRRYYSWLAGAFRLRGGYQVSESMLYTLVTDPGRPWLRVHQVLRDPGFRSPMILWEWHYGDAPGLSAIEGSGKDRP